VIDTSTIDETARAASGGAGREPHFAVNDEDERASEDCESRKTRPEQRCNDFQCHQITPAQAHLLSALTSEVDQNDPPHDHMDIVPKERVEIGGSAVKPERAQANQSAKQKV
jgi:hypothetical protein